MNRFVQLGHDIAKLWESYASLYLKGMGETIVLALVCTAVGCLIGLLCGILQTIPVSKNDNIAKRVLMSIVKGLIRIYVEVFRGTPMILQAVMVYYALPYFSGNALRFNSVWVASFIVVAINTGAYMAESVRGGIISIDPGQTEGAKAIGMTHWQTMINVILPQALRNILPQIGNNLIINIKDTSVMSIIGFADFFAVHKTAVGATYLYFPSSIIEMTGYLTMTVIASVILRWVEQKMEGSDSYELTQDDMLTMAAGTYSHPDRGTPFDERNTENRENIKQAMKNRNFSARGDR